MQIGHDGPPSLSTINTGLELSGRHSYTGEIVVTYDTANVLQIKYNPATGVNSTAELKMP